MKPDKQKLAVLGVLLVIIAFIITYSAWLIRDDPSEKESLDRIDVPELKEDKKEYDSRLEAVDDLSEKKPVAPPGLYDEELIDEYGTYDPYLKEKEKIALMDSILKTGPEVHGYMDKPRDWEFQKAVLDSVTGSDAYPKGVPLGYGHATFFTSTWKNEDSKAFPGADIIRVEVNGTQVIRKDERLELRLIEPVIIAGDTIPRNTLIYSFCSFQPNRLLLTVPQLGERTVQFEAYDLSDGQRGIYIQNSFRSQVATEVIDDVIQDINISGVPQVSGLKGIFQRSNRLVKVTVLHQYQLYLKPVL